MYLLDTNIIIYFMKGRYPKLAQRLLSYNPKDLVISSISVFELEYGAEKSHWGDQTRHKLAMFLSPFTIIPFTTQDAIVAGKIRGELVKQGVVIGPYDIQIAAQGLSRRLPIVTHNTKEFQRVKNLVVEDWIE